MDGGTSVKMSEMLSFHIIDIEKKSETNTNIVYEEAGTFDTFDTIQFSELK